ncbi:MAG TPA: 50S ribosomal protein L24e [Candidatus Nanoarchaeia archaeon]|nr:50S ribosomal protein L24e [Candidatus Nanoarchaeia archaeon]
MVECTFCGKEMKQGTGKMFVWASGKINWLCSRKCEKNQNKLKRNPARLKWTKRYRKGAHK